MQEFFTLAGAGFPRTLFSVTLVLLASLILTAFRVWLYLQRRSDVGELCRRERYRLFWIGFRLDSVVISRSCLAALLIVLFLPDAALTHFRPFLLGYAALLYFVLLLVESAGVYFFRYYNFRPNYLVWEHGADPEVLRTLARAYPIGRLVFLSVTGALALLLLLREVTLFSDDGIKGAIPWYWDRGAALMVFLMTGFATRGTFDHRPLNPSMASVTTNRIANEIASCGIFNVLYEWSHRLKSEFVALSSVIDTPGSDEALRRTTHYLSRQGRLTHDSLNPLVRLIQNRERDAPLNVVLVVMESFTARLIGCLGGEPALSPHLDDIARQGVLLEKCYATGERTIQGLEAVISSFPPLPGAGVVKRPQALRGFATLASILKERGYATLFLYGGQGIFDLMRSFFLANGYDRFIEEKDFAKPAFRGPWGVSDEDLFCRADQEFRDLANRDRSFFATLLTVSLHSPWEYPAGKIQPLAANTEVPPGFELSELNNFLYADFALGQFMRMAREAPYFDNTLFVFVGDHGVHLRGRNLIPVDDYRVAALLFAPAHLAPQRISAVSSQIDIPPTIMGILGGGYRSPFFGTDVMTRSVNDGLAIAIYNKKLYGIVSEHELVVLGDPRGKLSYARDNDWAPWRAVPFSPTHDQHSADGAAMLVMAERLLLSGRYTMARENHGPG